MNYLSLICGLLLLTVVFVDFFYTTLSCSGSGRITAAANHFLNRVFNPRGENLAKKWVGLVHIFYTLIQWVALIIVGGFLVFQFHPHMVIGATDKLPAEAIERLYYSIYVFSTLGNGEFSPGTSFSMLFTGFLSISGFAMLTTGITYLLSVTNAALEKKNLAGFIAAMGQNPLDLYRYFVSDPSGRILAGRVDELAAAIQRHADNHLSFPIVHYFVSHQRKKSVAVQLVSLYECLLALNAHFGTEEVRAHTRRLENALQDYLEVAKTEEQDQAGGEEIGRLRQKWQPTGLRLETPPSDSIEVRFTSLLKSQGWTWHDVYVTQP